MKGVHAQEEDTKEPYMIDDELSLYVKMHFRE